MSPTTPNTTSFSIISATSSKRSRFQTNTALPEEGSVHLRNGTRLPRLQQRWLSRHRIRRHQKADISHLPQHGQGRFRRGHDFQRNGASSVTDMAGFGAAFYDFDNDGWKDLFVTRGNVRLRVWPGVERLNSRTRSFAIWASAASGRHLPERQALRRQQRLVIAAAHSATLMVMGESTSSSLPWTPMPSSG